MATLHIDPSGPTPAYRQIADGLRALLVEGRGPDAGELMPTVRRLARDLGVHHNTVAQAYRLLAAEGWLELTRGRGATVRARQTPRAGASDRDRFGRRLTGLVSEAVAQGVSRDWLANQLHARARELVADGEV